MPRYALKVEYHGAPFAGWQRQADQPSVQGAIEDALARLEPGPHTIAAAGRTDALVEVRLFEARIDAEPQASSEIAELIWQDPADPTVACSDVVSLHILPFLARRSQGTGDTDA